jgi:hypothetical protein
MPAGRVRRRRSDFEGVRRDLGDCGWFAPLAPLPPGVPFEEQQLAALDTDLGLDLSEEELAVLAAPIRGALDETGMGSSAA